MSIEYVSRCDETRLKYGVVITIITYVQISSPLERSALESAFKERFWILRCYVVVLEIDPTLHTECTRVLVAELIINRFDHLTRFNKLTCKRVEQSSLELGSVGSIVNTNLDQCVQLVNFLFI